MILQAIVALTKVGKLKGDEPRRVFGEVENTIDTGILWLSQRGGGRRRWCRDFDSTYAINIRDAEAFSEREDTHLVV